MTATISRIDEAGRLIVPDQTRRAMHLEDGGPVVLTLIDGELRVRPVAAAMAVLQAGVTRALADEGASVDAFLAARRRDGGGPEVKGVPDEERGA